MVPGAVRVTARKPAATPVPETGHEHSDLWRWLDLVVVVALVLIVVIAAEWVAGKVIRERIA